MDSACFLLLQLPPWSCLLTFGIRASFPRSLCFPRPRASILPQKPCHEKRCHVAARSWKTSPRGVYDLGAIFSGVYKAGHQLFSCFWQGRSFLLPYFQVRPRRPLLLVIHLDHRICLNKTVLPSCECIYDCQNAFSWTWRYRSSSCNQLFKCNRGWFTVKDLLCCPHKHHSPLWMAYEDWEW